MTTNLTKAAATYGLGVLILSVLNQTLPEPVILLSFGFTMIAFWIMDKFTNQNFPVTYALATIVIPILLIFGMGSIIGIGGGTEAIPGIGLLFGIGIFGIVIIGLLNYILAIIIERLL